MKATINKLIRLSQVPIKGQGWLESLQDVFGEHHNYYRFLYYWVLTYKPKTCLEIGTWWGIGSAYMSMAAQAYGGKVIAIDINPQVFVRNILPVRFDNFVFIEGDSTDPNIYNQVKSISQESLGLVLQDSSHHYEPSCKEWDLYSPFLEKENSIWICDDITPSFHDPLIDPPNKGMVEYFNERPGVQKMLVGNVLHKGNTMGMIYR